MARKKLLTEGEIRQFMKLANLRPVGQNRLSEMGYPGQRDDEMSPEGDEPDMMGAAEEDPMGAGEEDMEMDLGAEAPAAEGEGQMVSMDDFMSALERAIEEVTGEEADVSEAPGEEEPDMGPDMGDEMGGEAGMPGEEGEEELELAEARKGHGGGARSDDPEKNKPGKFGKPDEDKPDKYAKGAGAGKGEKAEKRSGAPKSAGRAYRGMDEQIDAIAERLADELAARRARRLRDPSLDDPGRPFGEPDPMPEEPSEMLPGTEYDPEEEEELARHRRRKRGHGYEPPEAGMRMPAMGMEEHVVSEVAKRVAARLRAESRQEQVVEELAERIMKRLTK